MFEAQILITKTTAYTILSPWFPRAGDNMIITGEGVALDGGSVDVTLMTKNSEDPGDGADVSGTGITLAAKGTRQFEYLGGLDELVRYKFVVAAGTKGNWIQLRMLPPVWFDSAEA